jgi:hypothetical protein
VNCVGEIDRCGATRKDLERALGREDVNLIGEEIALHAVEEFSWVRDLLLKLHQLTQPRKTLCVFGIEPAAALYKGPAFKDYFGLRDIIASKPDAFARSYSEALIEYALGRPIGFRDQPLIDTMIREGAGKDYAVRQFIHTLIASREFHTK